MLIRLARKLAKDDGNTAVEFALVFPAFILMMMGTIETGRAIWTQSLLNYAVQSAARCGAVNTSVCSSNSATVTYAVQNSSPLTIPSTDFTVSSPSCGNQVSVALPFTTIVPQLLPFNVTLSAQACYPKSS